ncbi:F-box domain-containing protein [Mycena venus]|uniref:F-box domain-containing protein n=1 Tax=Mycena venus TaxID=2733690 RepID=A0A8H6XSI1_9AGAR|nr:F-box domain-containing protein [Mycena venus]
MNASAQRSWLSSIEGLDASVAPGTRHHTLLTTNEPPEGSEITFVQSVVSKTDAHLARLNNETLNVKQKLQQLKEERALLLTTNVGSELTLIHTDILDVDAHLACVENKISKLQERVNQLEEERVSLSSFRTRNIAILSPLRRVPPEVLGEIFWWTLPSITNELDWGKFDISQCPWVLTQISSRWRTISISTPSLWSRLVIDYDPDERPMTRDPSSAYPLSLAMAQIQRARKLKIHFYGCEKVDSRPQIQLFQLLSQHSSRWEELSLGLTSWIVPLLAHFRDRRFSSLKKLWITWSSPESQTPVSLDYFQTASSLVDVGVSDTCRTALIGLPVDHLTRYQLEGTWEEHKRILKLAHNLVEARIETDLDENPYSGSVDLLRLRHLYVSDPHLLYHLNAPVLEGLAFWVARNDRAEDDILQPLKSFLDRSTCPLRRLSLRGFPDAHATSNMLQTFPFITELAVTIDDSDASKSTNLLMSTLTVSDPQVIGSTVVAPQMRCLFFGCENQSYIDYRVYLDMLISRWRAEHCALNAAILATEGPGPDSATLDGLHELRREGLDLLVLEGEDAGDEMDGWYYATPWN